jgi:hypothetical protein
MFLALQILILLDSLTHILFHLLDFAISLVNTGALAVEFRLQVTVLMASFIIDHGLLIGLCP